LKFHILKGNDTIQIIVIGVAIIFGLPICVGLAVGHFFGFWLGVASSGLVVLVVLFMAHRRIIKLAQQQETQLDTKDRDNNA
jgi:uncharacterized membrane protein